MITATYTIAVPEHLRGRVQQEAAAALSCIEACNLSGVAGSLSRLTSFLWEWANEVGGGTSFVNTHPIVTIYVERLYYLNFESMVEDSVWSNAYRQCKQWAAGQFD